MLHGLKGDEDVMWVLHSALPKGGLAVALRGLYAAEGGGFTWVKEKASALSGLADFTAAVDAVATTLDKLERETGAPASGYVHMGFSQGVGLAFALVAADAVRPLGIAALAGFVPDGPLPGLGRLPVYWAHGTEDDQVPIGRAKQDVDRVRRAGADLTFCQDDVGHKVGVACMRGLKEWLLTRFED